MKDRKEKNQNKPLVVNGHGELGVDSESMLRDKNSYTHRESEHGSADWEDVVLPLHNGCTIARNTGELSFIIIVSDKANRKVRDVL